MNKIFILIFSVMLLKASIIDDFVNKKYLDVCQISNIDKYKYDGKVLTIIGKACLEVDKIYVLPYLIPFLKRDKVARRNAIYFLTILLQKRLLYSYFFDNFNINEFNLPTTDYILSKIFIKLKNKDYKVKDNEYIFFIDNKKYVVYKMEDKLIVDEFQGENLIKERWYR